MCVYWNFTDLDSVCLQLVKHIRIYSDSMESLCPEYIEIDVPCSNKPLSLLQDLSTCDGMDILTFPEGLDEV